jgi:hypothetical protein
LLPINPLYPLVSVVDSEAFGDGIPESLEPACEVVVVESLLSYGNERDLGASAIRTDSIVP